MSVTAEWPKLDASAEWLAAIATGDLHAAAQDVARSIHQDAKGDHYKAFELGLTRILDDGWITRTEMEQILTLIKVLREIEGMQSVPHAVTQRVRTIYHALLENRQSSPIALAFASGINNLVTPINAVDGEGNEIVVYLSTRAGVSIGAAAGALIGLVIGSAGGPGGGAAGLGLGFAIGGCLGTSLGGDD